MIYLDFGRASTVSPVEAVDALPLFDGILYLVPVAASTLKPVVDCTAMGFVYIGRIIGSLYRT